MPCTQPAQGSCRAAAASTSHFPLLEEAQALAPHSCRLMQDQMLVGSRAAMGQAAVPRWEAQGSALTTSCPHTALWAEPQANLKGVKMTPEKCPSPRISCVVPEGCADP